MARTRSLKPDFFKDEDLAELPFWIRILYEGLWGQADREGRLEDRPVRLKAEIFPYDKIDVEKGIQALTQRKKHSPKHLPFIIRYEVDGERYIQIIQFQRHQAPHNTERESLIPPFNGDLTVIEPCHNQDGQSAAYPNKGNRTLEGKREEALSPIVAEVVAYLNEKTGKRFSPKSSDTAKHISARIAEGRTLDDFKRVIDIKVSKWKGKKWEDTRSGREGQIVHGDDYLCPATLFCAKNFENYLNESEAETRPARVEPGANHTKDHSDAYWAEVRRLKAQGLVGQALTDAMAGFKDSEGSDQ